MDERARYKSALETIRDKAIEALNQVEELTQQRSMGWKCKQCDYMKHFTRPVPLEVAGKCPRCKSASFEVVP